MKLSDSGAVAEDVEAEIDYYAALTNDEVEAELRRYGIDPQPTIDAVTRLVKRRVSERAKEKPCSPRMPVRQR